MIYRSLSIQSLTENVLALLITFWGRDPKGSGPTFFKAKVNFTEPRKKRFEVGSSSYKGLIRVVALTVDVA